jgi:glutamate N-acetyltransferase/amino-acid N-acetyltransferase
LRKGSARAVLINSGCANCLTGEEGYKDALRLGDAASTVLSISKEDILLASTGLIGRRLPVAKIERAIPALVHGLSKSAHRLAAEAILTTDMGPKEAAVEAIIQGKKCNLGGMVKGAGMIAPNMATMICVLTSDVSIPKQLLQKMLSYAVSKTFNRISIDGDMSTNDSVFILANGASGVAIKRNSDVQVFKDMLLSVCAELAYMIIKGGEGVTKVMGIEVLGARTSADADLCTKQVANSALVKTMLAGGDPNMGRIAAAVGASGAYFDSGKLDIFIDGVLVVSKGKAVHVGTGALRKLLSEPRVSVKINLNAGTCSSRMLACDLTEEYVRINAGYAT